MVMAYNSEKIQIKINKDVKVCRVESRTDQFPSPGRVLQTGLNSCSNNG